MRTLKAKAAPTYSTPFTGENEPWGGRTMLSVQPPHPDVAAAAAAEGEAKLNPGRKGPPMRLSVMSYNVLADSNSVKIPHCPPSVVTWGRRREILLKEIFSIRADLLCLQDVDFFHQWWRPQLTSAGYDSLFKQRTCKGGVHREGVVIAWKRDVFDLFQSGEVELNRLAEDEEDRSLAGKAASSDNVALMVLLQPWQDSAHPLGACVVCTQLHDEQSRSGDAVRSLQARGITRTIEAFNADFQLPVILCGTMNCVPCSGTYQILCKGVEAQDPDIPGPPGKPVAVPLSTSSAHLWWAPPLEDNEALSPPVDLYKLVWIPGGSRFLGGESVDVLESDCLVYGLVETDSGNVRSEQNPLRSYIVTGLSSGVAYEFRVAAINELGQGRWSERSEAIRMPRMVGNDPEDRVLLGAASIKVLRERELEESLRRMAERLADPRAYELRKLVKFDGLVDLGAEKVHPFDSVSGMTPRYSDALLHPDVANVRADTGYPIIEPASEGGSSVGASTATGRRRRRRRKIAACESRSDTFSAGDRDSRNTCSTGQTTRADAASGDRRDDLAGVDIEKGGVDRASCCGDVISDEGSIGTRAWHAGEGVDATGITEEDTESLNVPTACRASSMEEEKSDDHNKQAGCSATTTTTTVVSRREADAVARLASLNVSGARSDRQRHALGLRSAYMSHWSGGEPAFTTLSDTVSATVDYIFFSADCLLPGEVLSLPEMGSLLGRDVQQTELAPTPGCWTPSEWQGTADEEGFAGEWCPYLGENPRRVRHRIPNDTFPSDHLMLAANLYFSEAFCPSTWQP